MISNQQLIGGGRNPYYDSLKFILIVFVVIAHVFEPTKNNGVAYLTVYNWINMFHMPLFIFISGRFSAMKDKKRYMKGIIRVLETYIVFQIIWRVYLIATGMNVSIGDWLKPYYTMWYIFSLVIWRVMVLLVADRIKGKPVLWITIGLGISLVAGFIPISTVFSFQRTLGFLPFFVAGYCTRNVEIDKWVKRISIPLAMFVLLASVVLVVIVEQRIKMTDIFCCATPYQTGSQMKYMMARLLFFIVTTLMCVSILRLVPSNDRLAAWGKHTLMIYIYHSFITFALFYLFKNEILPSNIPWLLLYSLIIIVGLLLLSRWKLLTWLLNPVTKTIEKFEKLHP